MPTPLDNDVLRMDGWAKGVNNRLRETESEAATRNQFEIPSAPWLRKAVNVDLTRLGHPLRRAGYTQLSSGFTHSLWSSERTDYGLCVKEGVLTAITTDSGIQEHSLGAVVPYLPMAYTEVNGTVYYANGVDKGRISPQWDLLPWGLPVPAKPELSSAAGGSLFPGTYYVAATFEDAAGEEYGASEPAEIALEAQSSLTVSMPHAWPDGAFRLNVYVTQANSEVYYLTRQLVIPGAVSVGQSDLGKGRVLETLDFKEPPSGHVLAYFNGRIYIARNDTVVFTEPLRYGVARPAQGIYMFPERVELVAPSTDGVYVGFKGQVVFLAGTDPYDVSQIAVQACGPVPRAMTYIAGERLGVNAKHVPAWWGTDGVMVAGLPGGQVRQLTRDRLAVPKHELGAMMLREREGMSQLVSVLRKGGETNAMGASDSVVAEIRRDCVKLN
jgi:hypothetical protein